MSADPIVETELSHALGERRERLAGEHEELERVARAHAGDGLEQEVDALPRAEI